MNAIKEFPGLDCIDTWSPYGRDQEIAPTNVGNGRDQEIALTEYKRETNSTSTKAVN